ncbi:alpha/beta hydrolase [Maribellus comscasis]|nr:alpha/beta fold hydrolase [Maribellus comscasis]
MKRIKRFLGILFLLLVVVYVVGPKPPKPELNKNLPSISASLSTVDNYVRKNDEGLTLKTDNESRIFWANDSARERTEYAVLYLHGFSASWYEGYPTHVNFAKHFGFNLYISRLASHGIDTEDPLIDMTPDRIWESAKNALMVARSIGKKVIIMSTSTGGTLALKLAADFPEYVEGLILYSPNIRINNNAAFILSKPWGLQIGRKVNEGKYRVTNQDFDSKECQYWNCRYRVEALVYLQQLVNVTMKKETYKNVTAPVFLGYYYKDENNQDKTVRVSAMLKMFEQLGTTPDRKVSKAFPEAGDHVIACELTSECVNEVLNETIRFGEDVMNLK